MKDKTMQMFMFFVMLDTFDGGKWGAPLTGS